MHSPSVVYIIVEGREDEFGENMQETLLPRQKGPKYLFCYSLLNPDPQDNI